jgi:hypothetical protein
MQYLQYDLTMENQSKQQTLMEKETSASGMTAI